MLENENKVNYYTGKKMELFEVVPHAFFKVIYLFFVLFKGNLRIYFFFLF